MARLVQDDGYFGERAPITEALVDLRLAAEVNVEPLRALSERLAARFPTQRTKVAWSGQIQAAGQDLAVASTTGVEGFLRGNDETAEAVQLNRSGLAYSKLKPYTNWLSVRQATADLWNSYLAAVEPGLVRRLAVRYINLIVPPEPWLDPGDWIRVVSGLPRIPRIPPVASDFQAKVIIQHPDDVGRAVITAGSATGGATGGSRALLLDIDVSCDVELAPDSPDIWTRLDLLRDFKNDVFFGSLTERARRLFE